MLIDTGKPLQPDKAPAPHTDKRMFSLMPFRAFKDDRLTRNDLRILIAACSFLHHRSQLARVPQQWIADQIGCSHVLVHRHVKRLEQFGYLVRLGAHSKDASLSILYGVTFDPANPPTKRDATVQEDEDTIEQMLKKEAIVQNENENQLHKSEAVKYPVLVLAWQKCIGRQYIANELELIHWRELSILGCTPEHLASWYRPGGPALIGYYMSQARQALATV